MAAGLSDMITETHFEYRTDGRITVTAHDDSGADFKATEYTDAACVAKVKEWEDGLRTKAHSFSEYRALVDDEHYRNGHTEQGI